MVSYTIQCNLICNDSKWYLFERVNGCCLTPTQQFFSAISWREQVNFQCDDDEVRFVLDQHTLFDLYSAKLTEPTYT